MIVKDCDLVIIGGGITALWIFASLKAAGFSVLLIEKSELGSGQTGFSQGILHAGVKYSLSGEVTEAARAAHEAIELWQQAMTGLGPIDLSPLRQASHSHCLVIKGGFQAQFKAMLTTQLVASHCQKLKPSEYPSFFQNSAFQGAVCQLDETVLNVPQVVRAFSDQFSENFLKVEDLTLVHENGGPIVEIHLQAQGENLVLKPRWTILAAGEGNADLLKCAEGAPPMQTRPLHMVAVKHPSLKPIFAHILEKGSTPSLTITTHQQSDHFWYVGGEIAESAGVGRNEAQQKIAARVELERCFPWLNLEDADWRFIRINRAEGLTPGGKRPDHAVMKAYHNCLVCWPTKLVLAPVLAKQILAYLKDLGVQPQNCNLAWSKNVLKPAVAAGIQGIFEI